MDRSMVVGLLGGVASGKSSVAAELARLGAHVIDADRVGHRVLRDPGVKRAIRRRWGDGVFRRSGAVDRKALAAVAFASAREQRALVRITHPPILRRIREEIARRKRRGLVVLDAALLAESGLMGICDATVFVSCDRQQRRQRAAAARGWPGSEIERRERYQKSLNAKRRCADYRVDNSGPRRALLRQVQQLHQGLTCRLHGMPTGSA